MTLGQLQSSKISVIDPEDTSCDDLPSFDNTKLTALNTCPRWGLIRYEQHKIMTEGGRAMALEAGTAAHDVFCAARLYQVGILQDLPDHMEHHGQKLFPNGRYDEMKVHLNTDEDDRIKMLKFCTEALLNSGFYNDPRDKRRTIENIEEACYAYLDRFPFDRYPVYIDNPDDASCFIGAEHPFKLKVSFTFVSGEIFECLFVGRIDGVHTDSKQSDRLLLGENKTAARLDDAWMESITMWHQLTGYCAALTTILNKRVAEGLVFGMAIPLPKSYDYGGIVQEPFTRTDEAFQKWMDWFAFTVYTSYLPFVDDPLSAPIFTHSCNRYFRPCSFIPLCGSPAEEQPELLDMMAEEKWSPLDD